MKTVGEILKAARLERKYTLEYISQETRINLKYLEAIESNSFDQLPAATFTKGFMQNYAKTIGLDPKNVLAIFRRDYDSDERGRIIPRGLAEPVRASLNLFTPTTTTIALSVAIGVIILGFLVRQIIQFQSAPSLEVSEPAQQTQLVSPVIVAGTTHPQASLTVNNRPITVNDDGSFRDAIILTPGEHTLVITSTSRSGKSRTLERIVNITVEPLP